jgi:hypothetical protein
MGGRVRARTWGGGEEQPARAEEADASQPTRRRISPGQRGEGRPTSGAATWRRRPSWWRSGGDAAALLLPWQYCNSRQESVWVGPSITGLRWAVIAGLAHPFRKNPFYLPHLSQRSGFPPSFLNQTTFLPELTKPVQIFARPGFDAGFVQLSAMSAYVNIVLNNMWCLCVMWLRSNCLNS